MKEIETFTEF